MKGGSKRVFSGEDSTSVRGGLGAIWLARNGVQRSRNRVFMAFQIGFGILIGFCDLKGIVRMGVTPLVTRK